MARVIKVQGRNNLPFYLPADAIVAYHETLDSDFIMVTMTKAGPIVVRATMKEMDALIASILVCPVSPSGRAACLQRQP